MGDISISHIKEEDRAISVMHLYFNFSVMYSTGGMSYFISKVGLGTSCALYTKISNPRNMLDNSFVPGMHFRVIWSSLLIES